MLHVKDKNYITQHLINASVLMEWYNNNNNAVAQNKSLIFLKKSALVVSYQNILITLAIYVYLAQTATILVHQNYNAIK